MPVVMLDLRVLRAQKREIIQLQKQHLSYIKHLTENHERELLSIKTWVSTPQDFPRLLWERGRRFRHRNKK